MAEEEEEQGTRSSGRAGAPEEPGEGDCWEVVGRERLRDTAAALLQMILDHYGRLEEAQGGVNVVSQGSGQRPSKRERANQDMVTREKPPPPLPRVPW